MRLLRYGALLLRMIEVSARFSMTITQTEWGVGVVSAEDHANLHVLFENAGYKKISKKASVLLDVPDDLSARLLAGVPDEVLRELEQRLGIRLGGISIHVAAEDAGPA